MKTTPRSRTLFPMFDETFDLVLPGEVPLESLFLLLSVKDLGPLGDRILLGEAIVPLTEVTRSVHPQTFFYNLKKMARTS